MKIKKEILKETKNKAPTQPKKVETLKGYTTSQINQALKADNPYPARVFLKVEGQEGERLRNNLASPLNKGEFDIPVF